MVDYEADGLADSADMTARIAGMDLMRVAETLVHALKERAEVEKQQRADAAREYQARYDSHAALARRELGPVMQDRWWESADLDAIREKYVEARAFANVDESFRPFVERIEERALALRDAQPDAILKGTVPPGPQPLEESQVGWMVERAAPRWYREWSAEAIRTYDKFKDPEKAYEAQRAHALTVREDMTTWRDHGTLTVNAQEVQEAWQDGEFSARRWRDVDPDESFQKLTDEQRHVLGWRAGGVKSMGPLDVDGARLLAATTAPGWYRVHDEVATDLAPALRERMEARLLEDMTQLRATGRLDTPSAREEWARFSGHPMATAEQDPNESLAQFHERRTEAFAVHWAATEPDRDRVSEAHGEHVGKPMSVAEAEEFAKQYAPDWLRERHAVLLEEAGKHEDPARAAWEQTSHREQFRYAMETARDTGGLGHPYAQALRSQAAMLGQDETEGMKHVPSTERVKFGGPAQRPMTEEQAMEMMSGYAPTWYQDQVRRTMREGTMIGDAAKRIEMDAVRADMTTLRDRGVLNSDHAQRLWAVSQPGYDPEDMSTWKGVDRRAQLWVETADTREQPRPMDPNNRERFGGTSEMNTEPLPVIKPEQRGPDDPASVPDFLKEDGKHKDVHEISGQGPVEPRGPEADVRKDEMFARGAGETPRQQPQETHQDDVTSWPTRTPGEPSQGRTELVSEELPGEKKKRTGPVYDSVERRQLDADAALSRGRDEGAVAGMKADDYMHPRPPSEQTYGRPANFDAVRERSAMLHAQRTKGAGPTR